MKSFRFVRPRTCGEAAQVLAKAADARVHAGGTDLLGLMKERIETPQTLVSLADAQGLDEIRLEEDGSVWIGSRVTLAQLAAAEVCTSFLPTLAEAAGQAASPQLRNRATIAGNLAQHTRCGYFRHASFPCFKRGDDACPVKAPGGVQDTAGVFGGDCVCAHPSSVAPVLGSLGAEITVRNGKGPRQVAFEDFWAPPRKGVATDTVLEPGDVIEAIRVPARDTKQLVGYSEIRQKAAFDWPIVSCAVRVSAEPSAAGQGYTFLDARVYFGSVASVPYRCERAEWLIVNDRSGAWGGFAAAVPAAILDTDPLPGGAHKVKMMMVALRRALDAARRMA